MRFGFVLLAVLFVYSNLASADERDVRIAQLFAPGRYSAEILALTPPPDVAASMREFESAMQRNPEWFKKYVEEHSTPGKPLPYHEKMGISQADYERIHTAKREFKLLPVAKCEISITKTDKELLEISGTNAAACLNGLVINAQSRSITYQRLMASECNLVEPNKTAVASISGVTWTQTIRQPENDRALLYLSVGQFVESPDWIFVNFLYKKLQEGSPIVDHELILRFPLQATLPVDAAR